METLSVNTNSSPSLVERRLLHASAQQVDTDIAAYTHNIQGRGLMQSSSKLRMAIDAIKAWEEQTGQRAYIMEHPYADHPLFHEAQQRLQERTSDIDMLERLAHIDPADISANALLARRLQGGAEERLDKAGIQKAALITHRNQAYITTQIENQQLDYITSGYLVKTAQGSVFFAKDYTTIWPEALTQVCLEGYIETPYVTRETGFIPDILVCSLGQDKQGHMLYFANTTLAAEELEQKYTTAKYLETRHIIS